jgi:hypothetical protein
VTVVCVKTIVQTWSANGPKPMRVWGKLGMTCPDEAAGGRAVVDARVALATEHSGRPFAKWAPRSEPGGYSWQLRHRVQSSAHWSRNQ